MILLILCIAINAFLGVIFKLYAKYQVNALPAIIINYFTCVFTGSIIYGKPILSSEVFTEKWFAYAVVLGICFISIFNLVALTVKEFGIMIASIFQKMSLIAPVIVGIMIYGESHSWLKSLGIFLSLLSIVFISYPSSGNKLNLRLLWIPLITWLGSCLIEMILYYVGVENIVAAADIRFVGCSFLSAGIFGSIYFSIMKFDELRKIQLKEVIGGIGLGIPNFFSIYLILLLLSDGWEGSDLFPINNVAILALSAIIGIIIFREKVDRIKFTGLIAAILAIILIGFN